MISSTSSSPSHEKYLKNKRNKKLFRYGLALFAFVSIIALTSYGAHRPEVRVLSVELSGGVLVTQKDIESKSLEYMAGSYLWLFPRNNIFLYSNSRLEKYLKENFKRIETINVSRKDLRTLSVEIKERKPLAMWCGDLPSDEEKCYFIDQNSTIFAQAPIFSGDAYFRYYGLISENEPIGTEYMASTTQFAMISDFISKIKDLSLQPQYLITKEINQFSLFIAGGGEIMFDTKIPLTTVKANLEALLHLSALAMTSEGILPIEYIDLRYGNKLFYKLK